MRHLLTAALLLAGTAAHAQAISADTMKAVTQELSSDAYEGRAPTTPAEDKTIAYIVQRFEKAGLKPGNRGQWTQDVPLVEITAQNVQPLAFTGGKAPLSLEYRKDMVIATYRELSVPLMEKLSRIGISHFIPQPVETTEIFRAASNRFQMHFRRHDRHPEPAAELLLLGERPLREFGGALQRAAHRADRGGYLRELRHPHDGLGIRTHRSRAGVPPVETHLIAGLTHATRLA